MSSLSSVQPRLFQSASAVLMVPPTHFGYNPEAASTNEMMTKIEELGMTLAEARAAVLREFDDAVQALEAVGVTVRRMEATDPDAPDAVFPNNWFSTHTQPATRLVLYPMLDPSRRRERRADIIAHLQTLYPDELIDYSAEEMGVPPRILEGTGALVLDRINRVAYAAISARCDDDWCARMHYTACLFHTQSASRKPIYHTNVVMSVGTLFAVVCSEVIQHADRDRVLSMLERSGRTVIEITAEQMGEFCGNVLEVRNPSGGRYLVLSKRARAALDDSQWQSLRQCVHGSVEVDVSVIERIGGGGIRCMLAELF